MCNSGLQCHELRVVKCWWCEFTSLEADSSQHHNGQEQAHTWKCMWTAICTDTSLVVFGDEHLSTCLLFHPRAPLEWKCSSTAWVQLPTMAGSRSKEKFCWCASCEAEEVVELCLKNLTVHFFLHLLLLFFVWTAFAVPPPTVYLHRIFWNGEGETQTNNDKKGKKTGPFIYFIFVLFYFIFFFCFLRRRFHIMKVRGFRGFLKLVLLWEADEATDMITAWGGEEWGSVAQKYHHQWVSEHQRNVSQVKINWLPRIADPNVGRQWRQLCIR